MPKKNLKQFLLNLLKLLPPLKNPSYVPSEWPKYSHLSPKSIFVPVPNSMQIYKLRINSFRKNFACRSVYDTLVTLVMQVHLFRINVNMQFSLL